MDPGRYGLHQGWENNSALEGYGAVHDSNFRDGGSYDDRRLADERFSRENVYPRGTFHRDVLERDNYPPPPPPVGMWPQTRRRGYEEEYYERDYGRSARYGGRDHDDYGYDDYDYRSRGTHQSRVDNRDRDHDYGRPSYDSDYDRGSRRDGNWRRWESRDHEWERRGVSHERDESPYRRHEDSPSRSRSRSHGRDDRLRSRSPRGRSRSRSHREDSYDDSRHDRSDRRRDRDDRRQLDSVAPSATIVVKGLSQKTTEEDLYQILAEWGPLRHVRVIKERNSGISRGFAFIDFPSVDSAQAMMDKLGHEGLLVDGRKIFFEYSFDHCCSSKPTGGANGSIGNDGASRSGGYRSITVPSDWMCIVCGCVNFARRTSCFQCNEPKTEDAPPADMASSNSMPTGKRGEAGPTHVLVVRGLDENADEEMLRYEFAKHAPIKDLRLVRDKFTHVSRGFAFVQFFSVEDATKALEATNGTNLEKNGQILRVAYAKSNMGPGSAAYGASQSSSRLAAAAIEAATFAQQYDAVGWAPKEYNPVENQAGGGQEQGGQGAGAPQSGFVWDEASGYYYDAASGFYYDGNTGLYYDGNNGIWYSFDQQTQQYIPCTDQNGTTAEDQSGPLKAADGSNTRKVVISASAATITSNEKASLPDVVQAAAAAALAAEKKEKEKAKEIKLASKTSIQANKKKMNNVLNMWKQRSHEGQAPRLVVDDNQPSASVVERSNPASSAKTKFKNEVPTAKENIMVSSGTTTASMQSTGMESQDRSRNVIPSLGGALRGVIRSSGLGVVKSHTVYGGLGEIAPGSSFNMHSAESASVMEASTTAMPFRTAPSALGSYAPAATTGTGKRRFSELPSGPSPSVGNKEQSQITYRDRAAERRSLYGSSPALGDDLTSAGIGDSNRDPMHRRGGIDSSMPFPPGVGGGRSAGDAANTYEVITADRAIDESNVGNRMLRSMGWHEGSGLGKDGSGMVEPVQARTVETRAGLGSHQPKRVDPSLEVQAGDSYKAVIQKKAIARFREMS